MASRRDTNIAAYERAVEDLRRSPRGATYVRAAVARSRLARTLRASETDEAALESVFKLDDKLRAASGAIPELDATLASLRAPHTKTWWWRPPRPAESREELAVRLALLLTSGVALCVLVEFARRMFVGRPDVVSIVIQGLLATLVGVGSMKVVQDLFSTKKEDDEKLRLAPRTRKHLALTLAAAALVCEVGRPALARSYDREGLEAANAHRYAQALQLFDRAIQLDPSDGPAHFHLATVAEASLDWATAESEYRASLRWGAYVPLADDRLAYVLLRSKREYGAVLLLTAQGLRAADSLGNSMFTDGRDANKVVFSLHAHKANALLGLQLYPEAIAAAASALAIMDGAAPHCIVASAAEQLKDAKREQEEWGPCITLSSGEHELEPSWIAHANARLDAFDRSELTK